MRIDSKVTNRVFPVSGTHTKSEHSSEACYLRQGRSRNWEFGLCLSWALTLPEGKHATCAEAGSCNPGSRFSAPFVISELAGFPLKTKRKVSFAFAS